MSEWASELSRPSSSSYSSHKMSAHRYAGRWGSTFPTALHTGVNGCPCPLQGVKHTLWMSLQWSGCLQPQGSKMATQIASTTDGFIIAEVTGSWEIKTILGLTDLEAVTKDWTSSRPSYHFQEYPEPASPCGCRMALQSNQGSMIPSSYPGRESKRLP